MLPLVFMVAANANAAGLIPGQCYAKADAEAVLKQEGQMPMIMGNRLTDDKNANVFFINKHGYGYNVEGNAPLGQKTTELCVRAAFKNTILNNINNPEIPSFAKTIKTTGNGIDIQKAYQNGGRIILGAQTYTLKSDGSEAIGKTIVVLASPETKGADVWSVDSLGVPNASFSMRDFGTTKQMADLVNGTVDSPSSKAP